MNDEENIFEVVDKSNRKIRLSKERQKHITSPSSLYAYMTNYLEEIKETLENSDNIIESVNKKSKVS